MMLPIYARHLRNQLLWILLEMPVHGESKSPSKRNQPKTMVKLTTIIPSYRRRESLQLKSPRLLFPSKMQTKAVQVEGGRNREDLLENLLPLGNESPLPRGGNQIVSWTPLPS